ncbi:MAG TPA: DUF4136 domain-containing protein [Povalibacter sp.]|nr:DUF4136 domain-containing protein [Povalibacter sp.]
MRALRPMVLLAMACGVIALSGCSSGPSIRADADPSANLSAYRSFGFITPLSTDKVGYSTIVTARLKEATTREMQRRGYIYSETAPQLLINFNINVENRHDTRSTPSTGWGGYYGYRAGMYGVWGGYPQEVETVHYQIGTLTIDVVDAARKQLVWQGIAQGRIHQKAVQNPGPAIDSAVSDIFAKYPVPAGTPAL